MPVGYPHLTPAERCPIHALLHRGWSKREIARDLGRDPGTISRETSRHRGQRGDRHQQADRQATARRQEASAVPRQRTPERWAVAAGRLQEGWSPEQIAGWVRLPGEVMAGKEWIYEHVRADRQAGGARYRCLRRRGKKPNGRGGRHAGRGHIPDRVDLAERPAVVEEKSRIGDWELEPIMGARHRGALVSAVDRGSKFRFLEWVDGKTASAVTEAITRRLGPVRDRVHTGTADHGKEFARHREIAEKLDAGFSFATPYPSWERGLNEHTNGLVRQYFPKGTDFRQVTAAQVRAVEDRLHRRPRKVLGYRTPAEVFARGLAPPGRGRRSPDRPPGTPVTHRSGLARPHGAGFALALADDFCQDRRPSRWLLSEAEKKRSQRGFLGRRRDPSLRATPSFRDRGAVALRSGSGE